MRSGYQIINHIIITITRFNEIPVTQWSIAESFPGTNTDYRLHKCQPGVGSGEDDEREKPVVVMETLGERGVPVVGGVVQGIHPLGRRAANRTHRSWQQCLQLWSTTKPHFQPTVFQEIQRLLSHQRLSGLPSWYQALQVVLFEFIYLCAAVTRVQQRWEEFSLFRSHC